MPTLKAMCKALGWPKCRRTADFIAKIKETEKVETAEKIKWPINWTDRGQVRHFDNKRNYPAAGPGIVYAKQIAEALGHRSVERVLSYYMYMDPVTKERMPGGPPFPTSHDTFDGRNLLAHDKYGSYYTTDSDAQRIYQCIKKSLGG